MEHQRLLQFSKTELLERVGAVKGEEGRKRELEDEIYAKEMELYELKAQQGGRPHDKPRKPWRIDLSVTTAEAKSKALLAIAALAGTVSCGEVTVKEHDSDDGIGHDSETTYVFEIDEERFAFSSLMKRSNFGWSGSRGSTSQLIVVGAAEGDFPLEIRGVRQGPLRLFDRGSWHTAHQLAEGVAFALKWRDVTSRMQNLLDAHGALVEFENPEHFPPERPKKISKRVVYQGDKCRYVVALGDRFESYNPDKTTAFNVFYHNDLTDEGITITVPQDNIIPYIWQSPKDHNNYDKVTRQNYLDYVEEIVAELESNIN